MTDSNIMWLQQFSETVAYSGAMLANRALWCARLHACPVAACCYPNRHSRLLRIAGHDLIGIAATGSGKTLAFVRGPSSVMH